MLSCKEVTHLLSIEQDEKLSLAERMQTEMHLLICRGCANYRKQMDFLRAACRSVAARSPQDDEARS